jgi:predicted TIM-barrel fold metal-dependent hydrolase
VSAATVLESARIIDVDTHVIETPELWTSRLPKKWQKDAPQVDVHPDAAIPRWRVGDAWLNPVTHMAHAGWREYAPSVPPRLEEADPSTWRPAERLKRMDEYGIAAQVLYPNILGFDTTAFMGHRDQEFAVACVRAYNDFLTEEYYDLAPDRYIPVTVIPFWNLDASVAEIRRCREQGHKGIVVSNKYEQAGLASFVDPVWDPLYAVAQEMDLSINFHVGFASANPNIEMVKTELSLVRQTQQQLREDPTNREARAKMVRQTIPNLMGNAETITALITSDLCERFPNVKFVSVESGFGYLPYLLDAVDWQWQCLGARAAFSGRLLPSEYFLRQCYGTFWFEKAPLRLLEQYPDNFMFETDFPHPISLSPGPASPAEEPLVHALEAFAGVSDEVVRKAVHGNAARVYHFD